MKKILLLFSILLGIGSGWRFMRSPDTVVPDACSCDGEHDGDFIVEHFAEICDKYCFSMWLPHGAMWTQNCFSTKSECEMELADVPNRTYANTCHQPEILTAWCVDDILTGDTRFYDSPPDTEYELMTTVCTRTESECHAIQRYQARHSTATCSKQMVFLHPGEASYLTPESELIEIIKKNEHKK